MRVLFASPEAHPLIKTGGLADVAGSLPLALSERGVDVRLVLPAYPQARDRIDDLNEVMHFRPGWIFGEVQLLEGRLPGSDLPVYLIDAPKYFDRAGHPYLGPDGNDWPDNHLRFNLFNRAIVDMAMDDIGLAWKPDIVHCHDWQTGLVPALLSVQPDRPKTIFTIHNMAYQGLFPKTAMEALHLPWSLWKYDAVEFWDRLSFMKGGLSFADAITTVSPTYAEEIKSAEYAYGLEGLLRFRGTSLRGILNGIDYDIWNPETDTALAKPYSTDKMTGKASNKRAVQKHFGLPAKKQPLLAHIGRLVDQKGVDLILDALPTLLEQKLQLVILGSGEATLESRLRELAAAHPDRIGIEIGYNEELAHLIEAGADMFLMPSRFEPCGLNQIYSLRYGTPPIVRKTGGLADTVVDTTPETLDAGTATGFVFENADANGLIYAVNRALEAYRNTEIWENIRRNAMNSDFSWEHSASDYAALYRSVIEQSAV